MQQKNLTCNLDYKDKQIGHVQYFNVSLCVFMKT